MKSRFFGPSCQTNSYRPAIAAPIALFLLRRIEPSFRFFECAGALPQSVASLEEPTVNSDLLSYYEAIEQASADMLEAARAGNWDEVVKLEGTCVLLISELKHVAHTTRLAPEEAQLKSRIMQRVLVNDARIRTLAEPWLEGLDKLVARRPTTLH